MESTNKYKRERQNTLTEGFQKFVRAPGRYDNGRGQMDMLVKDGQKPGYFVIACIDSRGNPANIFSAEPGNFFTHMSMGAIVRPYVKGYALSAALQFAIKYMNVRNIVLCGHTQCGAVQALVQGLEDDEISSFLEVVQNSKDKAIETCKAQNCMDKLLEESERQLVIDSLKNLKEYPAVREALDAGTLTIMPWIFNMRDGALLEYAESSDERPAGFYKLVGTSDDEDEIGEFVKQIPVDCGCVEVKNASPSPATAIDTPSPIEPLQNLTPEPEKLQRSLSVSNRPENGALLLPALSELFHRSSLNVDSSLDS